MKAYRKDPDRPFEPVILELQSQNEVDAIFALINHATVRIAVGLSSNLHRHLQPFSTRECEAKHTAIDTMLGKRV